MDAEYRARCQRCGTRLAHDNTGSLCAPCAVAGHNRGESTPHLPTELWDNQAMRDALTSRHMGAVIKAYRRHPFHGRHPIPQQTVAGWLGVTQGQLSRIENGPAVVHLDRLIRWARVLDIPSSCLWFTLPEDDRRTSPGSHLDELAARQTVPVTDDGGEVSLWWAPADTVEIISQFTRRDLTLDRREVTRLLAGVAFGSALLEPLERWLAGGAEKPRAGRPGSVGYQEVEQIEKAARIFRTGMISSAEDYDVKPSLVSSTKLPTC
jgi:transcriptional regulator with XRE-family HTH domain